MINYEDRSFLKYISKGNRTQLIQFHQHIKVSRAKSKLEICYLCQKKSSSFCNSHSIPAFVLRNISKKGKLATLNDFIELQFFEKEKGINNSGSFQIICRECDSDFFKDYENPMNYDSGVITQEMLAQIAVKNCLHNISKRNQQIAMINNSNFEEEIKSLQIEAMGVIRDDYIKTCNQALKIKEKKWTDYHLFLNIELDYTVPIAFQDEINLIVDLDGKIINDVTNFDPKYILSGVHLSVFPLKNKTSILMFVHKSDSTKYRSFYKKLQKMSVIDQLQIINFIIIAYAENFFLNPDISLEVKSDENLIEISKLSFDIVLSDSERQTGQHVKILAEMYDFSRAKTIPNILTKTVPKDIN